MEVTTTRRRSYSTCSRVAGLSSSVRSTTCATTNFPRTVNRGSSSMIADTTRCSTSHSNPCNPQGQRGDDIGTHQPPGPQQRHLGWRSPNRAAVTTAEAECPDHAACRSNWVRGA